MAVMARPVRIGAFECYIHRSTYTTWSVIEKTTGLVMSRGPTQPAAIGKCATLIASVGDEGVRKLIDDNPVVPPPDGLEMFQALVRPPASRKDSATIDPATVVNKIAAIANLTQAGRKAVQTVICTKGEHRGRLLAKPPCRFDNEMGYAAWMGLQPNHFKHSVGGILCLTVKAKEFMANLMKRDWPLWLDRDSDALNKMGVW